MEVERRACFSCLICGRALADLAANVGDTVPSVSSFASILETCGFSASANASLTDPELQQSSVSSEKAAAKGEQIKALTVYIKANTCPDTRRQSDC